LDQEEKMNADFISYVERMIASLKNTSQHLRTAADYLDTVFKIATAASVAGFTAFAGGAAALAAGIATLVTGGAAAPLLFGGAVASGAGYGIDAVAQKVNTAIQSDEVTKANGMVEITKRAVEDVRERIPDVQDQRRFLVGQLIMELDNIQKAIRELLEKTFTVESQSGRIAFNVIRVIEDGKSKAAQCFRDKAGEIRAVLQRYLSNV